MTESRSQTQGERRMLTRMTDELLDERTTPEAFGKSKRSAVLNSELARYSREGWRVEHVANGQAILSKNKRIGWFWNIVLTILTFGLWLIVVIYKVLNRKKITMVITVDSNGVIHRE